MSKTIPSIQKYMTTSPHSIGTDQTLATAEKMMTDLHIRHLPVLNHGELCGLVTDRDLKFVKGFKGVVPSDMKISDLSLQEVFTVSPEAHLNEVCDVMATKKFGCAVVMSNHKLVGIFTWIDALRAMSELLSTRLSN